MKSLTVVRHAKSSWENPSLNDFDRPLNNRGERDAPKMAERFASTNFRPDIIVSSPAVRAWTTASIFAQKLGYTEDRLRPDDQLFHASIDEILDVIAAQDENVKSLMIVGHNPGLTDFVNFLAPGLTNNLPTAGMVTANINCDDWALYTRPEVEIVLHDFPKNNP